jgi:large subunit ribosomal protein L10
MALTLESKQARVADVRAIATTALSAIAAEYRGLTVSQMTDFRAKARAQGVVVRVVKNSLAKRAVEGTEFECLKGVLHGPLVLAFSSDDPGAAARVVKDFAKTHEQLVTRAVVVGGGLYPASDLNRLANLPSLDQARARFLGVLQAPLIKLLHTLKEPSAKFTRLLAARRDHQRSTGAK